MGVTLPVEGRSRLPEDLEVVTRGVHRLQETFVAHVAHCCENLVAFELVARVGDDLLTPDALEHRERNEEHRALETALVENRGVACAACVGT